MKLYALDASGWQWLRSRAHCIQCEDTVGFYAEDAAGRIHAAVALDSWAPNSCQVHWAIENPMVLRRGFLEEVSQFAYVTRGVDLIIGLVPENNEKALALNKHLGLQEECRIKNGYKAGIDYVVLSLHRDNCRWLEQETARWEENPQKHQITQK